MKYIEGSKAVCLFSERGLFEIIIENPQDLIPVTIQVEFELIDEKSVQEKLINTLV
jgi:hypothetical protein